MEPFDGFWKFKRLNGLENYFQLFGPHHIYPNSEKWFKVSESGKHTMCQALAYLILLLSISQTNLNILEQSFSLLYLTTSSPFLLSISSQTGFAYLSKFTVVLVFTFLSLLGCVRWVKNVRSQNQNLPAQRLDFLLYSNIFPHPCCLAWSQPQKWTLAHLPSLLGGGTARSPLLCPRFYTLNIA